MDKVPENKYSDFHNIIIKSQNTVFLSIKNIYLIKYCYFYMYNRLNTRNLL